MRHGLHASGTAPPAKRTLAKSVAGASTRPPGKGAALRKVHTAESILEIAHLRNVLEAAGIACFVRNEGLNSVLGEIPFVECWPELWVVRNGEALRARGLIEAARGALATPGPDWTCERCGERVEGQFDACWHCAAPEDEDDAGVRLSRRPDTPRD